LLAWQVYQAQVGQQQIEQLKEKLSIQQQQQQRVMVEELNKTQFVTIPKELKDKFNQFSNM
jgi:hypothetical protein